MTAENNPNTIALTITFIDPELTVLTAEELDEDAVQLLEELQKLDDIDTVDRVRDINPSEGSKSIGGFLVGKLKALVNVTNAKNVLSLLSGLVKKPILLEVEGNGKKLKLTVNNVAELDSTIQKAKEFIEAS